MADKTTSLDKPPKRKPVKSASKTRATQARKDRNQTKEKATAKVRSAKAGGDQEQDTATKAGRKFEKFEGEIPEALAYFLDVYGRL